MSFVLNIAISFRTIGGNVLAGKINPDSRLF